jgi:hypothetical protein
MTKKTTGLALGLAIALTASAAADQWDQGTDPDNGSGTDNTLLHGSVQVHDLAAQPGPLLDEDWYLQPSHARSSYQLVVEGQSGDLDLGGTSVQRVSASGSVLDSAVALDGVLSLSWFGGPNATTTTFARVSGAGCTLSCDENDRYTVRFYETTVTIPRFNDSGTQATVLLLQNATSRPCNLQIFFLDTAGDIIDPIHLTVLDGRQVRPFPSDRPNQSGSVRIAHTCGYGGLVGKAVSVEPATGFTFDTPLLHRPR